jgi:hypothetical protein
MPANFAASVQRLLAPGMAFDGQANRFRGLVFLVE